MPAFSVDSALSSLTSTAASAFTPKPRNALIPEYTLYVTCADRNVYFKAPLPAEFDWGASAEYDQPMRDLIGDITSSAGLIGKGISAYGRANGLQYVTQALTAKFWTGSSTGDISIPVVLQAQTDEFEEVLKPHLQLLSLVSPRLAAGKGSVLEAPGPHFNMNKAFHAATGGSPSGNGTGSRATTSEVAGQVVDFGKQSANRLFNVITDAKQQVLDAYKNGGAQGVIDSVQGGIGQAVSAVDDVLRAATENVISLRIGNYIHLPSVVITDVQQRHFVQPVGGSRMGTSTGNMQRIELQLTVSPFVDMTLNDYAQVFIDPRVRKYVQELLSVYAGGNSDINGFF